MENNKINKDPMTKNEARFVSLAPHIRSNDSVKKIMLDVIIALIPAMIASVYFFGMRSIALIATCVISSVLTEYITQKALKKTIQVKDLSSVVTGILIALNMPQSFPLWMAAFGSVFAILIVKECFGGIGFNFMNPALAARLVLMASWPKQITDYVSPDVLKGSVDAVSSATPLQIISSGDLTNLPALKDMFMGNIGGVIGETSAIALLIGFVYLVIRKVISWEIPVIYVATTAVFLIIFGIPANLVPYELLAGGLLLGAIFMATDYTTNPINKKGRLIFAIGCGLLTALIRVKASLPEGVSYAICLMNLATPLIDKLTVTSAYGEAK
ncbi:MULTISPECIES: RnfABCDGE type electron transport complex subunit D [Peptoniphilus]|uniref:RnfABCDGE type electron transport complex subunit D n=1 Tax=Peptoniphilus TaxID=162289 RepID=UPI0008D99E97|nr:MULTISPECIES: RnfABCDGE type electron transport complex subunit D [Peptoniphilus]MBS6611334.1 RnfABCDGE type electron transport complex subunit D [Peptoniphilus harei]MDU1043764.1 RnfABCDGE type electron transport complex subunit D [Peptoniphilus rhinitidis]MDU1955078.1 RnfABCDGE type electron transport complex subunit D [Peptoniphilus lacydonensis]MDU2109622.1 RnfABCDGE type electron transport complex subunit D [Peptoniphilus lacydonensis]MDU2116042.1 RnfABCDGE type electron transport comp